MARQRHHSSAVASRTTSRCRLSWPGSPHALFRTGYLAGRSPSCASRSSMPQLASAARCWSARPACTPRRHALRTTQSTLRRERGWHPTSYSDLAACLGSSAPAHTLHRASSAAQALMMQQPWWGTASHVEALTKSYVSRRRLKAPSRRINCTHASRVGGHGATSAASYCACARSYRACTSS